VKGECLADDLARRGKRRRTRQRVRRRGQSQEGERQGACPAVRERINGSDALIERWEISVD
jgi:hypothetical protein